MLITPFFAAVFAVFYVVLSAAVIRIRFRNRISMGDGDMHELQCAMRVHANFIEYVPLALILFWLIETVLLYSSLVAILGGVLFLARILHVIGMHYPKNYLVARQVGVLATLAVLLVGASRIFWHYIPI